MNALLAREPIVQGHIGLAPTQESIDIAAAIRALSDAQVAMLRRGDVESAVLILASIDAISGVEAKIDGAAQEMAASAERNENTTAS